MLGSLECNTCCERALSSSSRWATTFIKLITFVVKGVRAGCVCVAIIHRTLTWTTRSLSCAQMLMHATAYGGVRTPKESQHWKLTRGVGGGGSLAAPTNRTCVSGMAVRCPKPTELHPTPSFIGFHWNSVSITKFPHWCTGNLIKPAKQPVVPHPSYQCRFKE